MRPKKFNKFEIYTDASSRAVEETYEKSCRYCCNFKFSSIGRIKPRYTCKEIITPNAISCNGVCLYFNMTLEQARQKAGEK